ILLGFNFGLFGSRSRAPIHLTLHDALVTAPFTWWVASSIVGFAVALLFAPVHGLAWLIRRPKVSPARRSFLAPTATAAAAAPFVAGAYGLLYGRLNLETPAPRIRPPHLPKSFDGFRIAQLSDIHIGPFMPQEEIRKYAAIANSLKPDMIVLTGD